MVYEALKAKDQATVDKKVLSSAVVPAKSRLCNKPLDLQPFFFHKHSLEEGTNAWLKRAWSAV